MADAPTSRELTQAQAQAIIEARKRRGEWHGGVRAHTEYQKKPVEWIVKYLGIPEHTIRWSLNPGYAKHTWDGDKDPLVKILEALADWKDCGCESATGTGKAQPIDEPVLTPGGWRPIGELQVGDEVIGSDGMPTRVLAVYPQGVRPVFTLAFSDGASTRACAEHLWLMKSKHDVGRGMPWRLLQTADLLDGKNIGQKSYTVPLPAPVAYPPVELPIHPYVLGVILGDGCLRGSAPTISTADAEVCELVQFLGGLPVVHRSGYDYAITEGRAGGKANRLTVALRDLKLMGLKSEEKFVPGVYLRASPDQRLALLRGLLDTDGSVSADKSKHIEFCTTSSSLACDVVELVRSLGGTARCRQSAAYCNGVRHRDRYRIAVNMPDGVCPFLLARKRLVVEGWTARSYGQPSRVLRSVEPAGDAECVCIRVAAANSLYVTKDFIVTHNTFLAACIVYWFVACFEGALVATVAPKEDQLLKQVWKEIGKLFPQFKKHFPAAEPLTGTLRMQPQAPDGRETWGAWAFVCGVGASEDVATKAQGFHAEHMLIITEETPGIHSSIMEALEQTRTDDHNLQLSLGNPDHQQDPLHRFCFDEAGKPMEGVVHVRISAFDHPNIVTGQRVVPGAIGKARLDRRIKRLGVGTRLYQSRVCGISPKEAEDALVKWDWCKAANDKYGDEEMRQGPLGLGVDVAQSPTGDFAAIARGQGACLTEVEKFRVENASIVGTRVHGEATDKDDPVDPRYIGVDSVGVGAATVNKLTELGMKVRWLSGSMKAIPGLDTDLLWSEVQDDAETGKKRPVGPKVIEAERFDNLRSQMWWRMREDLRLGRVALPDDEELWQDLCTPTFETKGGQIRVESKETIIVRLRRSPNKGDAAVYWNWVRRRTPLRRSAQPIPRRQPNRDTSLERHLAAHERRQKRDEQRFERMLKKRERIRRRLQQ